MTVLISVFRNNKEYAILFLLYFISNAFLLLNVNGMYWDDWWIYGVEQDVLDKVFYGLEGSAGIVRSKMIGFLSQIGNGVLVFRVLTFLLYFFITLFVFNILTKVKALTKEDVFFITIIFMVAPLNSARALAFSVFPYAVSLTIFFFSFYLLAKNLDKSNNLVRLLILALFFVSFLTNSLLVFYAVPLIYIFYQKYWHQVGSFTFKVKIYFQQNLDFVFLPIIFFIVKSLFFKSTGINGVYNSFDIWGFIGMPLTIPMSFYSSFLSPISQSFETFTPFWIIGLVLFIIPFKEKDRAVVDNNKSDLYFLLLGGLFFIVAVFPYLAVGKFPQFGDFASRHQLLIPLGFSFILYFFIKVFFVKNKLSKQLMKKILAIFIMTFIAQNIYINYKYKLDWFYQVGIEEHIKDLDIVKDNTTFVVSLDSDILELRNVMHSVEHNNRLKNIFGDETRLMIDISEVDSDFGKLKSHKVMGFASWVYQEPIYLKITKGRFHRRLFFYEFLNEEKFRELAKKLIFIKQVENQGEINLITRGDEILRNSES